MVLEVSSSTKHVSPTIRAKQLNQKNIVYA